MECLVHEHREAARGAEAKESQNGGASLIWIGMDRKGENKVEWDGTRSKNNNNEARMITSGDPIEGQQW